MRNDPHVSSLFEGGAFLLRLTSHPNRDQEVLRFPPSKLKLTDMTLTTTEKKTMHANTVQDKTKVFEPIQEKAI
eukprot:4727593-Amphidinium_carterae.1